MGNFSSFIVASHVDIIKRNYGVSESEISRNTGCSLTGFPLDRIVRYPSDKSVLRLILLTDELGYFRCKEFDRHEQGARIVYARQIARPLLTLLFSELYCCSSIEHFFRTLALRFGAFNPASEFWVKTGSYTVRLYHRNRFPDLDFSGPQTFFAFLWHELHKFFGVKETDVAITFPSFGIRDPLGFQKMVPCTPDFFGENSCFEVKLSPDHPRSVDGRNLIQASIGDALDSALTETPAADEDPLADSIRNLLEGRLRATGHSLDIDAVSDLLGISRRTLHRRLEAEGKSFKELRLECRISFAKHLLRSSRLSISEISRRVGFSEVSSFSRSFRTSCGLAPKDFRKTQG